MSENDDETEEPRDDSPVDGDYTAPQPKGRRRSFVKVRRELTEEELGSSGVQKMMLDELDRMEGAENKLESVSAKYHETSVSLAVSKEKLKVHNAFDIISTGTVAIGSLLIGAAFSLKDIDKLFLLGLIGIGAVLIIIGIVAKVARA